MTDRKTELEGLLAEATPGPWGVEEHPHSGHPLIAGATSYVVADCLNDELATSEESANAALICFLRNNAHHYLSLMDEVEEWKQNFIAFAGPAAAHYARTFDLPDGHLHPQHYDLLKRAGARMDSFTRAEIGEPK